MASPVPPVAAATGPGPVGRPEEDARRFDGVTLFYVWDALCGWCFGAIPAMRHMTNVMPTLTVAVVPGGLIRKDRVARYSAQIDYIRGAATRMEAATGQTPAMPFWHLIEEPDSPVANSAPPALAVTRMQQQSPGTALDFAHCLQEAHFIEGRDLNLPETYDDIIGRFVLPEIETSDLGAATDHTPEVDASYARSDAMGVTSFPTLILMRDGREMGRISEPYDGPGLVAAVQALL